ncbi:hypothetical protein H2203_008046 [Taxawa tesnikishii (nom. ined.)]|nr:hypothetical protein H2203_008046 [Dothideales sp. JES 119]
MIAMTTAHSFSADTETALHDEIETVTETGPRAATMTATDRASGIATAVRDETTGIGLQNGGSGRRAGTGAGRGAETGLKDQRKDKPAKPAAPVSSEPMIIVNVNDRLGTKAAIPCLASDPVKAFKAMVAARIGRQPHEIMLKRQGERPFKDQLTLEDYGVSNGVQLDLELDTGD